MSKKLTKLLLVALVTVVLFALASFNAFAADKTYTDNGTGMDGVIADAITDAANDDVTITLNGTWAFTTDTVFGDPETIPSHTITINGGENAEIHTNGYMPSFCGHFVFNNIKFVGAPGFEKEGSIRWDAKNGLYFPEGASCVIGTGCDGYASHTDTACGASLAGDSITVNSGKFAIICAQMLANSNAVPIDNPKITVQGTASAVTVCGLGYNTDKEVIVTGAADLTIGGSVNINDYLVVGGYYSSSSKNGGKLTVNTTSSSTISVIAAVVGSSGVGSSTNIPTYDITVGSSETITLTFGACAGILNETDSGTTYVNCNITFNDGVQLGSSMFAGFRAGKSNGGGNKINHHGNTLVTINGGDYYIDGTHRYGITAGCGLTVSGSIDASNSEIVINGGDIDSITAGASLSASNTVKSGTSTLRINHIEDSHDDIYGGSSIGGTGAEQTGNSTVYLGNSEFSPLTMGSTVFGGSAISGKGNFHANSKMIVENVNITGEVFAGSWIYKLAGGKHIGNSELYWISGKTTKRTCGGSKGVTDAATTLEGTVLPDEEESDGIFGGFAMEGNVKVTIEDGTFNGNGAFTGYGINIKGEAEIIIKNGEFPNIIYFLNDTASSYTAPDPKKEGDTPKYYFKNCSISEDLKIYISGGNFGGSLRTATGAKLTVDGVKHDYYGNQGFGVVGGNVYWEITGGKYSSATTITFNQNGSARKDAYIKFVGDQFDVTEIAGISPHNVARSNCANPSYRAYIDFSLVPASSDNYSYLKSLTYGTYSNGIGFEVIYQPLSDIATATVAAGDASNKFGALEFAFNSPLTYRTFHGTLSAPLSVSTYEGTYADLIEWDKYASCEESKTANAFKLLVNGNEADSVSKFTTALSADIAGTEYPMSFSSEIPTVTAATQVEFGYLGVSIRPSDNGLRARAYVLDSLRGRNLNDDGYKAVEYGVLVSKSATGDLVVGGAKTIKAVAFGGETDKFFVEDGKYTFAAAVTNIKPESYGTPLIFRPYIVLEDEAGIQLTIYADMTGVTNFVDGNNIKASLYDVATYIRDNVADFYTQNKTKIDAIING